jgi:hypothetical protein
VVRLGVPPDPGQARADEREGDAAHHEIEHVEDVLVGAAELQEHHVDEVRERAVHVADVAVVAITLQDRPRHVLKNALIAAQRDERRAPRGVGYPIEGRERHHERRDEGSEGALEAEVDALLGDVRGHREGGRALFPPNPGRRKPPMSHLNVRRGTVREGLALYPETSAQSAVAR